MLHETILKDDFIAQHSVATLLQCCFELLQHCSNIATLCCAKNRRCKSSRVTSPVQLVHCRDQLFSFDPVYKADANLRASWVYELGFLVSFP